jgi:putative heme-binding domain-containing protein
VRIVEDFRVPDEEPGLLEVAEKFPADEFGVDAARIILNRQDSSLINDALRQTNNSAGLVEAIGNTKERRAIPLLLPLVTNISRGLPARRQAVRSLAETEDGALELIQLAQNGTLPNDVRFVATMELNRVRWPDIKKKAAELLPPPTGRNSEALPPMKMLLQMSGDARRGAGVFTRQEVGCVNCHRINDKGVDLGPALSEIGTKLGKDALYEAILDPSAGIEFGYETWRIELKSGDELYGIIASETADELTLKDAKAVPIRVKKQDIASRQQLKISLMPSGLQQAMSTQDLVDVVEYLSSLKKAAN